MRVRELDHLLARLQIPDYDDRGVARAHDLVEEAVVQGFAQRFHVTASFLVVGARLHSLLLERKQETGTQEQRVVLGVEIDARDDERTGSEETSGDRLDTAHVPDIPNLQHLILRDADELTV